MYFKSKEKSIPHRFWTLFRELSVLFLLGTVLLHYRRDSLCCCHFHFIILMFLRWTTLLQLIDSPVVCRQRGHSKNTFTFNLFQKCSGAESTDRGSYTFTFYFMTLVSSFLSSVVLFISLLKLLSVQGLAKSYYFQTPIYFTLTACYFIVGFNHELAMHKCPNIQCRTRWLFFWPCSVGFAADDSPLHCTVS